MKSKSKILIAVLCLIAIFCATGTYGIYYFADKELENSRNFYFYQENGNDSDVSLSMDEISAYEPKYSEYASDMYFETLNDGEKLIYKAVVYAFENNETCIFVPESYIPSGEYSISDILYFVALDSPLVEQNVATAEETQATQVTSTDLLGFTHTKQKSGNYFYIDNFSANKMAYKLQAIKDAENLIKDMPADVTTDKAKVEYFFNHISNNSTYKEYGQDYYAADFLYDAVVDKISNCDGFTNELSLLCNMSGIDCFEKMTTGDDVEGHTWNCVKIDDNYYNVDVTNAIERNDDSNLKMYFSRLFLFFPDSLSLTGFDYEEIVPPCSDASLAFFDCSFSSENDNGIVNRLVTEFYANDSKYVCAYFTDMTESRVDSIVDGFLYRIDSDVTYYTEETVNSQLHYIVIVPD